MNDDTKYNKTPPPSKWRGLKVIAICIVFLAIFIPVFGQIVPKLLFAPSSSSISSSVMPDAIYPHEPVSGLGEISDVASSEQKKLDTDLRRYDDKPIPTSPAPDNSRLQALEEKVAKLEEEIFALKAAANQKAQTADNKVAIMVAFGQLREEVYGGLSYNSQLEQLKNLTANNPEIEALIARLEPNSHQGIATLPSLTKGFEQVVKLAMENPNNPSAGWLKNATQKFITIRKLGKQDGADDDAIFSRAEEKLNANPPELGKAVAELEKLSPTAKSIFEEWIAQANNHLTTKDNLYGLQVALAKQNQTPEPPSW